MKNLVKKTANPFKLKEYDLTYYFDELVSYFNTYQEDDTFNWNEIKKIRKINQDKIDNIWKYAKKCLSISEFQCFYLYYFENTTQERIAELLEVSQEYVNKSIKNSVKKIKLKINVETKQLTFNGW